ncbi:MAG: DUF4367 domain-containing protein [Eubacterium sp.]|jgi:hypothetical protein|nr:DUF4367 domain-containing protein [Eubacterium sp.]
MNINKTNLNNTSFNNLKQEYPAIPEDIRAMIEHEVQQQLSGKHPSHISDIRSGKAPWKKIIAAALVATIAVGTTTFAGSRLYRWQTQKEGGYGIKAGIVADQADGAQAEDSGAAVSVPEEIPVLSMEATYLPEGMIAADDGSDKYFYEATPYQGGVSIATSAMDQELSEENFPTITNTAACESIKINDNNAIYLEKTGQAFNKRIYIAYPGYWQIVEMYVGDDVTKEDAIKVAEGLNVQPTGETRKLADIVAWSDSINPETEHIDARLAASGEEMQNMHAVGEAFPVNASATTPEGEWIMATDLEATVTDIQIADDLSLLNSEFTDSDLLNELDSSGTLANNSIKYIKSGDGINTIDEETRTEEVAQKLVYATVEYKNTGDAELKDILFFASFVGLTETDNGYEIYDRALTDGDDATDAVAYGRAGGFGEMDYFDIRGGEENKNYISSLQPGETVTLHVAKIVNADELDKMYLSLNTSGSAYEFSEESLNTGYVDIRQADTAQ